MVQATQEVHQRTLAGTACTHQRNEFTAGNVQCYPTEHRHRNLAEVVGLVNVFQFDQIHDYFGAPLCSRAAPVLSGPSDLV